jgi:hypothetical protein
MDGMTWQHNGAALTEGRPIVLLQHKDCVYSAPSTAQASSASAPVCEAGGFSSSTNVCGNACYSDQPAGFMDYEE